MKSYLQAETKRIKKFFFFAICSLLLLSSAFPQNAGISPAGTIPPDPAAGLDINFSGKGFLIPRLGLTGISSSFPLPAHVAGIVIYNTSTSGDVTQGLYFDDGTKWIPVSQTALASGDMQFWDGTRWKTISCGQPGQMLQLSNQGVPAWVGAGYASIETSEVNSITSGNATTGGNISIDGGSPVVARGVCWAETVNPTVTGSKTSDSSGTGSFTSNVSGLTAGITYYLRAYATNSAGTSYGIQLVFKAL
jgi:hypothetical protein